MVVPVTPEEMEKFKELNRIRMKLYRDKDRKHKYTPRKKCDVPNNSKEEKKQ